VLHLHSINRSEIKQDKVRKMDIISELRKLLQEIGITDKVANRYNQYWPLAGRIMDSLQYTEFSSAVEEHFGIRILEQEQGKFFVRSLNDFKELIEKKCR